MYWCCQVMDGRLKLKRINDITTLVIYVGAHYVHKRILLNHYAYVRQNHRRRNGRKVKRYAIVLNAVLKYSMVYLMKQWRRSRVVSYLTNHRRRNIQ